MSSEMIERATRAMYERIHPPTQTWDKCPSQPAWRLGMRAAIEAMRVPTEGMIDRGQACLDYTPIDRCEQQAKKVWGGMVDEALR